MENLWFTSEDGLKLHALVSGPQEEKRLPIICLPGISRTAEDFRTLLEAFAREKLSCRRAYALDSRGRGLSERDRNPANYSVMIELADLVTVLRALKIERAIFIGTSRGGLLAMALATLMPSMIAGSVLNDIGPAFDMAGFLRIKGYVGKMPHPRSWPDAVHTLKKIMGDQFPALSEKDWNAYARRTWNDRFEPMSDPAIAAAFDGIDAATPPPTLWPQFEALAKTAPALVIRGENSDLLSRETLSKMKCKSPDIETMEAAGQGHAPVIENPNMISLILRFVSRCDVATAA